jgi:hypothetical protein
MTATTMSRLLIAAMLITVFVAALATTASAASKTQKRAERAVVRALVLQHGVGTRAKARCRRQSRGRWTCGYAAVPRSRRAVFAGRASVTKRMRVRLGRQVCTGGACKRKRSK